MAVATASWFLHKTEKSTCCNSFPGGLGNELVARRCSFLLCKKVEPDADKTSHSNNVVVGLSLRRMVNLTTRCPTGYKWRKNRHTYRRAISRITTTMRALPVSELNGPFLCPTHLAKEVCLESNQHLCLARQCPHRCVPVFSPLQARWYPLSLYNLRIFLCLMNILLLWVSCLTV